jgi:hypothetical protein
MKTKIVFFSLLAVVFLATSCQDQCTRKVTQRQVFYNKIYQTSLADSIKNLPALLLKNVGKIYLKDQYLFVNEQGKGMHILDNSTPSQPKNVGFIAIPGSMDMAVMGNYLYADNFTDIVVLDISNPLKAKEIDRIKNAFNNGNVNGLSWYVSNGIINEPYYKIVTTEVTGNCNQAAEYYPYTYRSFADASFTKSTSSAPSSSVGVSTGSGSAGSMARFGIDKGHLYAVTNFELLPLDINIPTKPVLQKKVILNWGIETIFPYGNYLFLGSTTGMHIYDNTKPSNPTWVSTYTHVRACDPVVVHKDLAYVTLRSQANGFRCGSEVQADQLEVIDVKNPKTPQILKIYPMNTPAGLAIDFPTLFVCEGKSGLKVYDATDPLAIDKKLIAQYKGFEAYDVIAYNKILYMIGTDGLRIYDYSDLKNIKLLNTISTIKTN